MGARLQGSPYPPPHCLFCALTHIFLHLTQSRRGGVCCPHRCHCAPRPWQQVHWCEWTLRRGGDCQPAVAIGQGCYGPRPGCGNSTVMRGTSGLLKAIMADIDVETSNVLFETLENWNEHLKGQNIKPNQHTRPSGGPARRGPSPC